MKILQVINAFYPPYSSGGAAHVAHNISVTLAKRGHEVTVYTTNALSVDRLFHPKQTPNHENGVKVYYFTNMVYKPSIHIYFSKELVEAIKKSVARYDIVHLHEYRSYISLVTSYCAKKHDVPYILQVHGQLPRIVAKKRLKWAHDVFFGHRLLRDASKVIALSRTEVQQYRGMGVPDEKIAVMPNGIDLSEYAVLPPKGSFKKKFSIDDDEKIVLYLGRIHRIKGIDILVKAFAKVSAQLDNVRLVIVGPDDGYLNVIKALVKELDLKNKVLFIGPIYGRGKFEAYIDSDFYVLPSRYETFPNSLLEAYMCSKLVVTTKINAMSDLVIHGKTGLLVPPEDEDALADAMMNLLNNSYKAKSMGQEAFRFVSQNFTIEKVVDRLEIVYKEINENS